MDFSVQNVLMAVHVLLGTVAVVSGAIALVAKKGSIPHIKVGQIFVISMITSSLLGSVLGLVKPQQLYITFHAGILGVTLIASSWLTVRKRPFTTDRIDHLISSVNILNTAALIGLGIYALQQTDGTLLGFHGADYLFLAVMAGIAAVSDISLIFRKAVAAHHRLARHLWRMCFGFFIAAGSAFTGPGANAFPKVIQDSGILSLPELLIFLALIYWLGRVLFTNYAKKPGRVLNDV